MPASTVTRPLRIQVVDRVEGREVQQDTAGGELLAAHRVPTAADRDGQAPPPGEPQGRPHLVQGPGGGQVGNLVRFSFDCWSLTVAGFSGDSIAAPENVARWIAKS